MSYENNRNNTPIAQSSLGGGAINEEETLRQANIDKIRRRYRLLSILLISIIVVTGCLLITQVSTPKAKTIEVTVDNWSDFFVISKEIVDSSLILDDDTLYSMDINYSIRLKDYYVDRLDTKNTSKVSFSLTYKECMDFFEMDYTNLTYKESDSFSTVKNCEANVVLEYPQAMDSKSNIIYTASIFGGGDPDDNMGIGIVGREFAVTAVSGTLYFKTDPGYAE